MISKETFLQIFVQYNTMIFPVQIVFYLGALFIIYRLVKNPGEKTNMFIDLFLGIIWVFMGIFYHLLNYAKATPVGYLFGTLFIIGGVFFLLDIWKKKLKYDYNENKVLFVGISLLSLIIYEIIGYLTGHIYPEAPVFSAPCPTSMFTLGMLMLTIRSIRIYQYLVPLSWSLFAGLNAPKMFGIFEDYLLLLIGLTFLVTIIYNRLKYRALGNSANTSILKR